ncbi:hypothetical protein [Streptomyces sp. NPDC048521]|uniref:hypothetical protein n=1 Tax=Streptomyces sp. NPDC048521 TaxID=3365566 RepID=UPI003721726F
MCLDGPVGRLLRPVCGPPARAGPARHLGNSAEHADRALLTGPPAGPTSGGQPLGLLAVPRQEHIFEDTSDSLGMRHYANR